MYTFMAVYMHFYRFIELMINYHTHPFNIIGFKKVVVSLAMEPCDRLESSRNAPPLLVCAEERCVTTLKTAV